MSAEQLGEQHYFIRDEFTKLAEAAHAFANQQSLAPAGIQREGKKNEAIRSDETVWLDDSPLHASFEALREELNRTAYLGLTRFDVQLARYAPSARYVRHLDAFPGRENRRVTAIVYLNPEWKPEHGGQLRLHVKPPRDVKPLMNRLVVFLSEKVEHEVLPAHAPRLAMTAWYYGPAATY
jgi:SM-20-related protein